MATLPPSLKKIAFFLERLPGIGEKTANRLAFYLLRLPEKDLQDFAVEINQLKARTKRCRVCLNLTEADVCDICSDRQRDQGVITVVESVLDILSLETGNIYQGVYHVLHGRIDPLNNIGPDDIFIAALIKRIQQDGKIKEVILATNPDMEGEATAMYIRDKIKELKGLQVKELKITRLGYGLPMGASLEYADYMTLKKSLENRSRY
ncbi:recombination mediator RecR [Patescibacteria group bacterium]|nr:recombination mediator RecR [Patescibacteria group bacterium]MCL5091820.1 recombination mediator RecR [Patescibacteria group bacterium]